MANPYTAPRVGSRKLWELDVDKKGNSRPGNDPERDDDEDVGEP